MTEHPRKCECKVKDRIRSEGLFGQKTCGNCLGVIDN